MALRDQPYLPLYVQDYLTDEKLNACCAATQGVYIKIMCILHKSDEYGKLLLKQKDKQNASKIFNFANKLAKLLPFTREEIEAALTELLEEGVMSIDGDTLFQKRMVKDGEISEKRALAASRSVSKRNNPAGFATAKRPAKPSAKRSAKAKQNTENENEYENENDIENVSENEEPKITPQEQIFAHWNAQKIIVHKELDSSLLRTINGKLRTYQPEEIMQAISNYRVILSGDEYYFSYKWTLKDFLSRGLDKFKDFEIAASNYRNDKKPLPNKQAQPSRSEKIIDLVNSYGEGEL